MIDNITRNDDAAAMTYPGGKNGSGVYQKIINLMPPHEVYIEPFLGKGAIMRNKQPTARNIGIEKDTDVQSFWQHETDIDFITGDGINFLKTHPFQGNELVYCDPPYLQSTRSGRQLYRYEMTDEQHIDLLETITDLPCMVMISGYWSQMYADHLKNWNTASFEAMTRGGKTATEWLWFNFQKPVALHDYRYLGENYRERERIKKKKSRWVANLKTMPVLERQALLSAIKEAWPQLTPPPTTMLQATSINKAVGYRQTSSNMAVQDPGE